MNVLVNLMFMFSVISWILFENTCTYFIALINPKKGETLTKRSFGDRAP